jgi:polyhydroxyalkanoate synthesis regulator phasin
MLDLLKKGFLAGLGTTAITKEKAEEAIQELVEKGKLKREDADELLNTIISTGESEMEELRKEFRKTLHNVLDNMDLASKTELEKLSQKLDNLEKRVDLIEPKDQA